MRASPTPQQPPAALALPPAQATPPQAAAHLPGEMPAAAPTPLSALLREAEENDPAILAAQDGVRAAAQMPAQASALPDPHFNVQQFSVGSPRPFAGYTNSDFAYIGFGASQELPYPGKRRLRSAVAERETDVRRQSAQIVLLEEIEKLEKAYYRLAYLQQTLAIHHRHDALLDQIAEAAGIRYRAGQGNQHDLLKAQLERTRVLRELAMNREAAGELQVELKRLLHRAQDSPDIVAEPLVAGPLPLATEELIAQARQKSPDVRERAEMVRKSQAEVDLAHRDFRPDFGLSYMWQRTDPEQFRAYYMLTFDVNFPRRKPRQAALAGAEISLERARHLQDAQLQATLAEVQRHIVTLQSNDEQARIYRDGLIPQAGATFEAGMAAYTAGREDFQTLLSSVLDVVDLELSYQQVLLDRQLALLTLERLTGGARP
ncbi:MAG TPA: TolC family protein [Candidatus Acidoferrales bacterium]|nr:TolC family protein [Candidatus Acidoferrales bacterium]